MSGGSGGTAGRLGPRGLPYRPCVGVVLIDPRGLIFAGHRIDTQAEAWQMPQGGIDAGETPRQAALRELTEEIGVAPELVEVLGESPEWLYYDLPDDLVGRIWGGKFGGQCQKWFAMRFLGTDADIRIDTAEPEFNRWQWTGKAELIDRIVPFKRDIYRRVVSDFADLLA